MSSTWSSDGTKVIDLYGGDQKQDRLLFLAPSTGRNATLLGEISDTDTESNQIDSMLQKVIERAELRITGQRQQREQYAKWRRERKEQEEEFTRVQTQEYGKGKQQEQEQETNKDTEIRKARRLRTSEEPLSGTTIVIRCNDGARLHRKFQKNACFQEVYDWLGSLEDKPLYFTLQRGKAVIEHTDILEGSEVLDLLPHDDQEVREVFSNAEVTFRGNNADEAEDFSKTAEDLTCTNQVLEGEQQRKRKRKDNRSRKERKKKQRQDQEQE